MLAIKLYTMFKLNTEKEKIATHKMLSKCVEC